tara:strand:- start:335 stop:535 length:201 start_codon:yes stop_codon:yes gene_type:complete
MNKEKQKEYILTVNDRRLKNNLMKTKDINLGKLFPWQVSEEALNAKHPKWTELREVVTIRRNISKR